MNNSGVQSHGEFMFQASKQYIVQKVVVGFLKNLTELLVIMLEHPWNIKNWL